MTGGAAPAVKRELMRTTSARRPRNSHIFARDPYELYVEPSWTSKRLFAVEQFPGTSWDPCCGTGTIPKEASATGLPNRASENRAWRNLPLAPSGQNRVGRASYHT